MDEIQRRRQEEWFEKAEAISKIGKRLENVVGMYAQHVDAAKELVSPKPLPRGNSPKGDDCICM